MEDQLRAAVARAEQAEAQRDGLRRELTELRAKHEEVVRNCSRHEGRVRQLLDMLATAGVSVDPASLDSEFHDLLIPAGR